MQKVVTINLNGNAYQLDESAYDALRTYLTRAEAQLEGNPDRAEILADFEQAIAEKCGRYLGPAKTVVTAAEMQQILSEMGPVEGTGPATPHADAGVGQSGPPPADAPRKRFYRIREDAMFGGVCTGLAAYFGVDVVLVRILVLVLAVLSMGWGLMAYWLLVFIVPEALTSEEHAAAHGQPPFNAQTIMDHAKQAADQTAAHARKAVAGLKDTRAEWRRQWREQRRQWRAQRRDWRPRRGVPVPASGYGPPMWPGVMLPIFSLFSIGLFVLLIVGIASLINGGTIFGWPLPAGIPLWAGILILVVLFQIATSPIRAARQASYGWARPYGWLPIWDTLVAIALTGLALWLVYTHMPPPHDFGEFIHNLPGAIRGVGHDITDWFRSATT